MQAAWHVAQYAAHHAVAVDMDDMLALSGKSVQRISSAADVGSVVHELASASTNPEPIAVFMRASPQGLLRLVPHLPALAKLPVVFHVETPQALHAHVLQLRHSGISMVYSSGEPRETEAYALFAHILAAKTHTGALHFFDTVSANNLPSTQASLLQVPLAPEPSELSDVTINGIFSDVN